MTEVHQNERGRGGAVSEPRASARADSAASIGVGIATGDSAQHGRRRLHGTRQVIEFNWPRYAVAAVVAAAGLVVAALAASGVLRAVGLSAALTALWWTVASIAASWWVYDASGLTTWRWLAQHVDAPSRWINVHAGFDETTSPLAAAFSGTDYCAVNLYEPGVITERSIERARQRSARPERTVRGSWNRLPLPSNSQDAVFLLFAAHEIRRAEQRAAFFREAARVLSPAGRVVLVEHLRDAANFIAFGPGFLHFQPRIAWIAAAAAAGLPLRHSEMLNPFVALFVWEKGGHPPGEVHRCTVATPRTCHAVGSPVVVAEKEEL